MRAIPSTENILLYVSGYDGHSYVRAIHTYIMGFHTHQNQTYCTFTVMRAIQAYVIPVYFSAGWIIQRWNHFHFFCTLCAASPLFLGLASYLLDHCQIIVMMSRSVLCSRAIGCSSIQCEHSWSEWEDENLTKLTVIGPQSCSEAIIWEALQNILRVHFWFPWDRRVGRCNLISMRSDLSIEAQLAVDV